MLTIDLYKMDKKISEMDGDIDFYALLTPLNREEEMKTFFSHLSKGETYNPVFRYIPSDFEDEKKWLIQTESLLEDDNDIERLFKNKIRFMLTQIELISCEDKQFSEVSIKLFGSPDSGCIDEALDILNKAKEENYVFPEETVTPEEMASILQKRIEDKGVEWTVKLSEKIVPKMTISGREKTAYINSKIKYTKEEVERLKIHEVDVHILRGANGYHQPFRILAEGFPGYNETEEGLAIFAEEKSGCLKVDTRQMKLYAGRALCAEYCLDNTFYDTFVKLREFFPDYVAYRLTERAKRGLQDTSCKGGITKGSHYISGWKKVRKYIADGGDISILYVGKVGLEDIDTVKRLLDKFILEKPVYLPEF